MGRVGGVGKRSKGTVGVAILGVFTSLNKVIEKEEMTTSDLFRTPSVSDRRTLPARSFKSGSKEDYGE